jgi:hypothetical protein
MAEPSDSSVDHRTFHGQILVGSRIIDYLSSGLYKSPAACLKELVNNSYDADATVARILVKPDADRIIIDDDGVGMDLETFERHFSKISESHKRDDSDVTPSGRPKIGKIGIGFIAANEICEEMEIFSTCEGSSELLHVTIDFARMREPQAQRRSDEGDYAKGDYYGEILEAPIDEHYTRIFLKRVRGEARDILAGAKPPHAGARDTSLYGLKPATIRDRLANLTSWSSLDDYSQTRLGVALNVPVRYPDDWVSEDHREQLQDFEESVARLGFRAEYDGTDLERPVVLTGPKANSMVKTVEFAGNHVAAKGWLYAQHGTLRPEELNGVLIRIRNAAVGEYNDDFLGFPHAEGTLFQRWITAELYADDRLEDALNIDRRTLRDTHPAYVELRQWFHEEFSGFLTDVRRVLYTKPAAQRKRQRVATEARRMEEVASAVSEDYGKATGARIAEAWLLPQGARQPNERLISRKYSVSELYRTVLAVAREVLPPHLARRFIDELTRRLRG